MRISDCSSDVCSSDLDLRDLERGGLLGRVRVLGAGVDLELLQHLAAQAVLGEHAPDGLLDGLAGVLLEELTDGGRGETSRVARNTEESRVGRDDVNTS